MIPGWLTIAQAAAKMRNVKNGEPLGPRRVLALIKDGRLPAVRFGREWAIKVADIAKVSHRKQGRPRKPR